MSCIRHLSDTHCIVQQAGGWVLDRVGFHPSFRRLSRIPRVRTRQFDVAQGKSIDSVWYNSVVVQSNPDVNIWSVALTAIHLSKHLLIVHAYRRLTVASYHRFVSQYHRIVINNHSQKCRTCQTIYTVQLIADCTLATSLFRSGPLEREEYITRCAFFIPLLSRLRNPMVRFLRSFAIEMT